MSFLDIISCGFGAVVVLVLLSRFYDAPNSDRAHHISELLMEVLAAEAIMETLNERLALEESRLKTKSLIVDQLKLSVEKLGSRLDFALEKTEGLMQDIRGLSVVREALQEASDSASGVGESAEEVAGIVVDGDYVVFIVDTSGSMKTIWNVVVNQLEKLILIHPHLSGFQILNDNGSHLIPGYSGRWIPDTEGLRKSSIKLLRTWNSVSNSSPVEGLEVALKRYAKPNKRLSIYIFGDDYTGSSYDAVINAVTRLNIRRSGKERLTRVHAVGFLTDPTNTRFATLMREVTRRSNGTFLALPRQFSRGR